MYTAGSPKNCFSHTTPYSRYVFSSNVCDFILIFFLVFSDEDCVQRLLVFGELSKIVMDFWFHVFRANFFLEKVGKIKELSLYQKKTRKYTLMKSDAFEGKSSGTKELYERHNSSLTQPYTMCSTCFLTPLLWVQMTLSPTSLW